MMKKGYLLLILVVAVLLVASGCGKCPDEDLAKAEQAVQAAKAAGAAENCADKYAAAEAKLAEAQQACADKDYEKAKADANETMILANVAKGCPPKEPPPPPPAETPPPPKPIQINAIYFDYNKYNIRPDAVTFLKAHAEAMKAGSDWVLEGHCDERGTAEYNMALGERRAKSAKNYLITLGVKQGVMKVISFGENKPADPGHTEAAWAKNRRVEFKENKPLAK